MLNFKEYHKKMKYHGYYEQQYGLALKNKLSSGLAPSEVEGFTLVEFLVVMGIFLTLGIVSFFNFQNSQIQAKDAERKDNIKQIGLALDTYYNDHGFYPLSENGKIKSCNKEDLCFKTEDARLCDWKQSEPARQFCDENYMVYLEQVPTDPNEETPFCYISDSKSYKLYAKLENIKDAECFNHDKSGNCLPVDCNNQSGYTFGTGSSETKLF